jgi:diguanylate cyclase (GGDEF)-like protein
VSSDERSLKHAIEVRLQRRLSDWADELERLAREHAASQGVMGQSQSVAGAMDALDRHIEQVHADLATLLVDADAPASEVEWLSKRFATHLDQMALRVLEQLSRTTAGQGPPAALRNRLLNQTAQAKARARADLTELAAKAQAGERQRRQRAAQESLDELDDRLPLRRRRVFDRDLVDLTRAARSDDAPLALMMIDLDHFKRVNDEHGHPVGDEVLLAVAQLIVKRCAGKGRVYRYGGEEIAVLLPSYSCEEAQGLAERIRKDIAAQPVSSRALSITASIGVATFPDQVADESALLTAADSALYRAKHAGRNCVRTTDEP